jgi:branched-chain amino acid transport system permease protein
MNGKSPGPAKPSWLARIPALEWLMILALLLLPIFTSKAYLIKQETSLLIYVVLGLALHTVVGNTGQLHLGIAAFFGIGAYTTGILAGTTQPFGASLIAAMAAAMLAAVLAGVVLSAPALRLRGDYLALVTLGFGEVMRFSLRNLDHITNGTKTISPIPTPATILKPIVGGWFTEERANFVIAWVVLALVVLVLRRIERSRLGRAWVAVREDELAASCMGLAVPRVKLAALAMGAGLAGLAGSLYAMTQGNTSDPDSYGFNRSAITLCCLILGGLGGIRGAIAGTLILLSFDVIFVPWCDEKVQLMGWAQKFTWSKLSTYKLMIFGFALILMMRFRPEGLLPTFRSHEEWHDEPSPASGGGRA